MSAIGGRAERALEADVEVGSAAHGGGTARRGGEGRDNLPHSPSTLVGRRREITDVAALLGQSRLVTVAGPPGVGKTRVTMRVATRARPRFPGGVWLVQLASLSEPGDLPQAVARAILPWHHVPASPSPHDLAREIADEEMLIVLDGCEHVVEGCAQLAEVLLESCPGLGILTSSREPLGIAGEHVVRLAPLSLPEPGEVDAGSLATSEAGELFVRRAAATASAFAVTGPMAPVIARICQRLDGLPLLIELAAARVAALSVEEILERLDDPVSLLNTGRRTAEPRQRSLAATFAWSYDLLTPSQALLLERLAVFEGWTIEAAETVCAGGDLGRGDIVDELAALVNKSLVVVDSGDQRVRYRLLGTVRTWARARLDAGPESADVSRRHAMWCVQLAERAEAELRTGRVQPWLDQLETEHPNLSAAFAWARSSDEPEVAVRLAAALPAFWRARGDVREGAQWLDWAIGAVGDGPVQLRAKTLRGAGLLHGLLGELAAAVPLLDQSAALASDTHHDVRSCNCNPMTRMFENPRLALPDIEERMGFCRRTGDAEGLGHLFLTSGQAHFFLGEPREARMRFQEAVRLGREQAHDAILRSGLFGLARVAFLLGDFPRVEVNANEALVLAQACGSIEDEATALAFLGDLARVRGDWEGSRGLLERAVQLAKAARRPLVIARAEYLIGRLDEWEGAAHPDELVARFETSLEMGRAAGGPPYHELRCLLGIGWAKLEGGDPVGAAGCLIEALEKAQAMGDLQATAMAFDCLGGLSAAQGNAEEASMLAHRGLELHHRIGEQRAVVASLERVASLAVDAGRHKPALRLLGSAQGARDAHGYARSRRAQRRYDVALRAVRSALDETAFVAEWSDALARPMDEAVVYALRGRGGRDRPGSGWESLTPAERDVVRLVGEGLTNPEVGRKLFISPRTVGHHLTHVYDKVGVRSRHGLIKELAEHEL